MSSGGVLVQSEGEPIPSGKIELSIAWPVSLDGGTQLQLFVSGNVLRQEGNVVAVTVDRYEFRTRAAEPTLALVGGRSAGRAAQPVPQM